MRVVILFSLYASLSSFFPLFSAKDILNFGEKIIGNESTLVSGGNNFEMGFFTFNGSSNSSRSYLGIWYYSREPRTVVWVANRDNPVVDSIGVFQITKDGNLTISDIDGNIFWASRLRETTPTNKTILKLEDSGNMVVSDKQLELWQSFDYPTDTFLVGMNMNKGIELISWRDSEDPGNGNFTFKLLAQTRNSRFIILRKPNQVYWLSEIFGSLDLEKTIPTGIVDLLTNFTMRNSTYSYKNPRREPLFSDYKDIRLVMNLTGHIQQQKWEELNTKWSLVWWKPADQCEQYNACGNFSSCHGKKKPPCSCLTGFNPKFPDNWSDGDFSGGCVNKSASCGQDTRFLDSKISKLFDPNSHVTVSNETECRSVCQSNCPQCLAYSYDEAQNVTRRSGNPTPPTCRIWSQDLPTLQEENPDGGRNISVRVEISDRASIVVRACEPCGLNIIPYPLSTGPNCGDPMYLNFKCDNSTGQLSFISSMGSNRVTSINLQSRKLSIQVKDDVNYCAASASFSRDEDNLKFPFNVTNWCLSENEVEVSWQSPSEPPCNKSMDCKDWIHSTCTGNET